MQLFSPIFLLWGFATALAWSGELSEMDDELLADAFDGARVPGFSDDALRKELSRDDARSFIEKVASNERLRKNLIALPQYVEDQYLRDHLIKRILSERNIWLGDQAVDPASKLPAMQAYVFSATVLEKEFFVKKGDPEFEKLSLIALNERTRERLAGIFERVTKLDETQRVKGSPEMNALTMELRNLLEAVDENGVLRKTPLHSDQRRPREDDLPEKGSEVLQGETHSGSLAPASSSKQSLRKVGRRFVVPVSLGATLLLAVAAYMAFGRKRASH